MGAKNNLSYILPYKVYVANLNQASTDAPIANVFQNTIGVVSFSYIDVGSYEIAGSFTEDKTVVFIQNSGDGIALTNVLVYENLIQITTTQSSNSQNDVLTNASIEIRVYP